MKNRPRTATGPNPNPVPHPHGVLQDWMVLKLAVRIGPMKQRRERKYVQLAHDQHKDHDVEDVNARIAKSVPNAHKSGTDRDGDPHQDEVAEQIGIPLEKEWLARRDGVTRDTHLIADGQRVNKVANFKVGGYNMRYPADSSQGAPAGEIVNCRCTVIYHEKRRI